MECSISKDEKEQCDSSTVQGKTFIITPDKIARLGLVEQIKRIFKSQVAPKISQDSIVTTNIPIIKKRVKTSNSETTNKFVSQLVVTKTDQNTANSSNVPDEETLLTLEKSQNSSSNTAFNKIKGHTLKENLKGLETVISTSASTEDKSCENIIIDGIKLQCIDNFKLIAAGAINTVQDRQVIRNNSVIVHASNNQRNTVELDFLHTNGHHPVKPFKKRGSRAKCLVETDSAFCPFQFSNTNVLEGPVNIVEVSQIAGSKETKQLPLILKKRGRPKKVGKVVNTHCALSTSDTSIIDEQDQISCLKERDRPNRSKTVSPVYIFQASDSDVTVRPINVVDSYQTKSEETKSSSSDISVTSHIDTSDVLIEGIKNAENTGKKAFEIDVSNINDVVTCNLNKATDMLTTGIHNNTHRQNVTPNRPSSNKIHVLSIKSVFLAENDLKQISQSVVRDRTIPKLPQAGSIQSNRISQISANVDHTTPSVSHDVNISSNLVVNNNSKIDIGPHSQETVLVTSTSVKKRKRKSEKSVLKEAEKPIVLETKRIRKKKHESEFITDEEYETAMEMAENMGYVRTYTNSTKRGRQKKSEVAPIKSESNENVPQIIISDVIDLSETNESECNLSNISGTEFGANESVESFISPISLSNLEIVKPVESEALSTVDGFQNTKISLCNLEIVQQEESEALSRVDKFQSAVPSYMQNCLTSSGLSSYYAHQGSS